MAFILQDGGRYQRRAAEARRRFIMLVIMIVGIACLAYWWGKESVRSNEVASRQQTVKMREEYEKMQQAVTTLRSEVQSAQLRYQQLEEKYKQDIPSGAVRQIMDVVKKQISSGIKPERLIMAIDTSRPPKNCSEPVSKRFVMKTPVYSGPHGTVSFGNGLIVVSGQGQSAVSPTGSAEAWYDPGKPVSITFTQTGADPVEKTGLLPIQYSVVSGSKEYRFTVAAGERSFISVTSDSCDYP